MKRSNNEIKTKLRCNGLNFSKFLNKCITNGITLHSINRLESGKVDFELSDKDYSILKKLNTASYNIEVVEMGGFRKLLKSFVTRIGLFVGLAMSMIAMFFLNNRLLQVHIYGLDNISKEEVVRVINELGINTFSKMDFDKNKLEQELSKRFNFSLVSIATKGNSLLISVKEELPDVSSKYIPIIADYNMIIKSIDVYSGTGCVSVGEVVYKGDTLVESYTLIGEEKIAIEPCAKIVAEVFFNESSRFWNKEEIMVKTGEKQLINVEVSLGTMKLNEMHKDTTFTQYEIIESSNTVSQYFLPIQISKTYAYELEQTILERNFDDEKDAIIENTKSKAYLQVPNNVTIDNEDVDITEINNGYIVNVYLHSTIEWNYSSSNS